MRMLLFMSLYIYTHRRRPCEPFPSAWTACGSARRRSPRRMRSTRTSARGTPRESRTSATYAPPFGLSRAIATDALGGSLMRRGRCARRHRRCARVCAHVWALGCVACPQVGVCCFASGRRNICAYIYSVIGLGLYIRMQRWMWMDRLYERIRAVSG